MIEKLKNALALIVPVGIYMAFASRIVTYRVSTCGDMYLGIHLGNGWFLCKPPKPLTPSTVEGLRCDLPKWVKISSKDLD